MGDTLSQARRHLAQKKYDLVVTFARWVLYRSFAQQHVSDTMSWCGSVKFVGVGALILVSELGRSTSGHPTGTLRAGGVGESSGPLTLYSTNVGVTPVRITIRSTTWRRPCLRPTPSYRRTRATLKSPRTWSTTRPCLTWKSTSPTTRSGRTR